MQYDLLLTGGEVLDPGAGLRGTMDIGIVGGKIAALAPSLPAAQARRTLSAKGRLVTPGLVDMHAHVLVNGHDATDELRTETAGAAASAIAVIPSVRQALVDLQHGFRKAPGLVADGRDMGTVIFPDAAHKFFLTASAAERAKRRYKQLKDKGLSVTLATLQREIEARDERDASRPVAPLKPAEGAVVIDTTGMPIDEVVAKVFAVVRP